MASWTTTSTVISTCLTVLMLISCVKGAYLFKNSSNALATFTNSYQDNDNPHDIGYSPGVRNLRQSKFFPLFTIIRFTNEVCRTSAEEGGICYTRKQCTLTGGTAHGTCAQGLGVCCQFVATCGNVITQNGTMFRNPNYPTKYAPTGGSNVCQVRIRKANNICQLRFNFIKFDIDGPMGPPGGTATGTNDAGSCKTDALSITSSGATVPQLCGILNDQHLYVDYGTSDTITLNLLLSGNVQRDREWNIEILMIPCNAVSRAPVGCLQYFTGVSGQVESFNYPGGVHLANQDYSVCVRMEDGMRAIEWSGCATGSVKITGPTPLPAPTAGTPPVCTTGLSLNDYLIIMGGVQYPLPATPPAGTTAGASTSDRYCDNSFGTVANYVRSTARPFILHMRTDATEAVAAMDASVGFCLKFQQSPQ